MATRPELAMMLAVKGMIPDTTIGRKAETRLRCYAGSNHVPDEAFNTTTRPAWMNWVIDYYEQVNNYEVTKLNNPDPSDAYDPVPYE